MHRTREQRRPSGGEKELSAWPPGAMYCMAARVSGTERAGEPVYSSQPLLTLVG